MSCYRVMTESLRRICRLKEVRELLMNDTTLMCWEQRINLLALVKFFDWWNLIWYVQCLEWNKKRIRKRTDPAPLKSLLTFSILTLIPKFGLTSRQLWDEGRYVSSWLNNKTVNFVSAAVTFLGISSQFCSVFSSLPQILMQSRKPMALGKFFFTAIPCTVTV